MQEATNWLDDRTGVVGFLRRQAERPVSMRSNFLYFFGGLTFFFFLIQVATGMLLAVYYVATPAEAHASVEYIQREVSYGWLIRGLHHWGSSGMVLMVGVHMMRVFFSGAYKPPRELTWVVGVILLVITLVFSFTGYLLPWDQKAYWATQVGTNMIGTLPMIGDLVLRVLRGGADLTGVTLARFYAIHVLFLPALSIVFLLVHFLMIRRHGISDRL